MVQTIYMCWFKKSETGQPAQESRDELHGYWHSQDEMNNPSTYLESGNRSEYFVSRVKQHARTDAWVIELGCYVRRSLLYPWGAGYRSLSGLEIIEQAIRLKHELFPDMKQRFTMAPWKTAQRTEGNDLVFTVKSWSTSTAIQSEFSKRWIGLPENA
jgi:hypothetical protein